MTRGHELARALGDAAGALEDGDAVGAAAALAQAARCQSAIPPMRAELAQALGTAGSARRATTAYRIP